MNKNRKTIIEIVIQESNQIVAGRRKKHCCSYEQLHSQTSRSKSIPWQIKVLINFSSYTNL